ncbi:GRAM domain-containing protein, partial [Psidium guajava]
MASSPPKKPSSPKAAAAEAHQPSSPFTPTEPAPTQSSSSSQAQPPSEEEAKKWGTHVMGTPAVPTVHPDNQKAASWNAADHQQISHQPYVQYEPIDRSSSSSPLESVIHMFNTWSKRAETIARNIWHNLKTGQSVSGAAWGKVNLTAKAISEGGFESLFKQIFTTEPNEKLKKTFACYLSTSTGPVAGTLYLSTARAAFCSDRPLSFTAPSGQEAWSYYKVMIPLANIGTVNPVVMKENPPEKYIQIVTADGHDFWFMGFVNFDKASHHLLNSLSEFRTAPPVMHQ